MNMKTKSEIVGQLLKDGKITSEEAIVLLVGVEKEYVYIPQPYPVVPYYPWGQYPIVTYTTAGVNNVPTFTLCSGSVATSN